MNAAHTLPSTPRQIMLVDDHEVMREGFARLIEAEPDLTVSQQFGTAREFLSAATRQAPDLAVIDICLDDVHGLELIKNLRAHIESLPILALSMYDESLYAERAMRAGANGYVTKRSSAETVLHAIRTVLDGELWLALEVRNRMVNKFLGRQSADASSLEGLSDREFEVFQLIGQGLKLRHISERLGISPKTVDTYRTHLKTKLNLNSGAELVRCALHWVDTCALRNP